MMRARLIPILRALCLCPSGNLFERIEMKIRLSTPSTTSKAIRVRRAAQAAGSVRRGAIASMRTNLRQDCVSASAARRKSMANFPFEAEAVLSSQAPGAEI